MFSLFKKTYHEAEDRQIEEVRNEPIGPLALAGENCDEISGAQGPFGHSYNNPIPVNGLLGAYKYLGKLISPRENIVYFHRIGSVNSDVCSNPVDAYEIVDLDGGFWDILFVDMYHPRRSNKTPERYSMKRYDKEIGDIPFVFGVDIFCANFPYDLPDAIEHRNDLPAFARRVRERVSNGGYDRPKNQELKLAAVRSRITSLTCSDQTKEVMKNISGEDQPREDAGGMPMTHRKVAIATDRLYYPVELVSKSHSLLLDMKLASVFAYLLALAKANGWHGGNEFFEDYRDQLINRKLQTGMYIPADETADFVKLVESLYKEHGYASPIADADSIEKILGLFRKGQVMVREV